MGKKLLVIILFCCVAIFCVQWSRKKSESHRIERSSEVSNSDDSISNTTSNLKLDSTRYELPTVKSSDRILHHFGYSLLYNEAHEQASWVAYELTSAETNKIYERTDRFITDPLVSTGTATDADYKNSGYDRGHLAPASDMGWSDVAMVESST
jgi:endonuclease G